MNVEERIRAVRKELRVAQLVLAIQVVKLVISIALFVLIVPPLFQLVGQYWGWI